MQFILGPYDPLKSPLHYQQSTLNGTYSPKSLNKLVLLENGFISSFFEVEMNKMCSKIVLWLFLPIFRPSDPLKGPLQTNKVHLRAHILSKSPQISTTII